MTPQSPRRWDGSKLTPEDLLTQAVLDAAAFAYLDMEGDSHERRIEHAIRCAIATALRESK